MATFSARPDACERASETFRDDAKSSWNADLSLPSDACYAKQERHQVPGGFPNDLEFFDSAHSTNENQMVAMYMQPYMQYMRYMIQMIDRLTQCLIQAMQPSFPEYGPTDGNSQDKPDKHPDKPKDTPSPDKTPDKHSDGQSKPDHRSDDKGKSGHTHEPDKQPEKPEHPDKPKSNDHPTGKNYADVPVERGRTIYRDDFNGDRGERPNSKVFDTAHIGLDGKTRQRGPSIHEDGIISTNNTVMDGNGHLQLFAKRERTFDKEANEYVNYTKGSMHTADRLTFNLQDYPNGIVIEARAKHPTATGAKFDGLWIMTDKWSADLSKGEKQGSTIEYDAAEGGGADISIHYPTKNGDNSKSQDHYAGGAHPKDVDIDDGNWHTYTVVIKPNPKTGRGDVVQYIDGKKEFAKESVFPGDKDLHLKASMEVSPKWTHKTLTAAGGMDSNAAGYIDYIDISELKSK